MHTPACASSPPSNPPAQALLGPSPQPGALHAPIPCYLLNRSCHKPSFLLQNTPLKFLWLAFTLPQPSLQLLFSGPKPPSPPTLLPTDTTEVSPPKGQDPSTSPAQLLASLVLVPGSVPRTPTSVWMRWHEATSVQVALLGDQGVGKHSGQCCSQGVVLGKYLVPSIAAKQLCWIERLSNEAMRLSIYFYSLKVAITSVKGADCFTASRKNEHKFCCCVWREETLLIQHPAQ